MGNWRAQTKPCAPGPRRKEQWPHKKLIQTCLWVSRSLQWRCGLVMACCRVGGTECRSIRKVSFEGGHHFLHYLHHCLWSEVAQSCPTLCNPMGTRLLCPWDFLGKSTGVGCHSLLQEIFPTQGLNSGLPHCRQMLNRLSHQGSPTIVWPQVNSREGIQLHSSTENWIKVLLSWTHSSTLA